MFLSSSPTLWVITGPTAVGKTAFCIDLAEKLHAEIISSDARQCYRGLIIGTAQPTQEEQKRVTHHLINHRDINQSYHAAAFAEDVKLLLPQLFASSNHALMTGGSGLYIEAVCEGLPMMPSIPSTIQKALEATYQTKGLSPLLEELRLSDPVYYKEVDQANPRRILRALSVCRASKKAFSFWRNQPRKPAITGIQCIQIALYKSREELYKRIDQRVIHMVKEGLFEEAAHFFSHRHLTALQTIGYQEIFGYMEGKYTQEEAIQFIQKNTRHYAKRQFIWLKRNKKLIWYTPEQALQLLKRKEGIFRLL